MYYILRASTPLAESWVLLTYALLIAFAFIASRLNPGLIVLSFKSLFSYKERDSIFYIGSNDTRSQILVTLFCTFIIALNMQLGAYQGGEFVYTDMLILSAAIVGVFIAKYLVGRLLCYVFLNQNLFMVAYRHYQRMLIAISVILIPITIIAIYTIDIIPVIAYILYGLVTIFYLIAVLSKFFMLFYNKILASFYIFLYLCSAEFVPLLGLFWVAQQLAK